MTNIYNHSNNHPIGNKIIVFIDSVIPEKTKGGIYVTVQTRKDEAYQATTGIVFELGETAFKDCERRPVVGNRVTFRSYAGIHVVEPNGETDLFYRILEDKEIHAIYSITPKPILKSKKK